MKIIVDRVKCLSIASCVAIASNVYELDKEGKAVIKNIPGVRKGDKMVYEYQGNNLNEVLEGAEICPYLAIEVYDDNGKKLFPKPWS